MMLNSTFTLWDEMKAYAKTYAASDRPMPVDADCERLLQEMIVKNVPDAHFRDKAFEFYAVEMCRMISDLRDYQRLPPPTST